MKKLLSILLVAVLVSAMFAVPASAMHWSEDEVVIDGDGNYNPAHAWGYVFNIDSINTNEGASTCIFTNSEAYLTKGGNVQWKSHVILEPTEEDNVYTVASAYKVTGKKAQEALDEGLVDFEDGQIVLIASDSGTRPETDENGNLKFPNWEDRAACWGLVNTIGAKLTLANVDLAAGTCENGTLTVEANPNASEDDNNKETISYNLVAESTPWELTGDGEFSYDGDVLTMHANKDWPCIQAYYAEAISVTVEDFYLVYDIVVEGETNFNFIFGDDSTFSFSNTTLGLEEGEYNAGSGDLPAGTYTGKIALTDLVTANAYLGNVPFPASAVVDGVLTFKGINVFSVGTDVDVVINKLALETEVESDGDVVEITNVAAGKEYTVSGAGDYVESYVGNLTDGIANTELGDNKNAEWYALYHNGDRPNNAPDKLGYIIIDLEDEYTLSAIKLNLINMTSWGVAVPEYINAYVSLDGNAFEEVGSFEIDSTDGVAYWTETAVDCKAKFVKIEIKLGGTFAFISEIEVYGGKGGNNDDEPAIDVEKLMQEALGAAPADGKVEYVIEAPESYEAGDEITVKVTVKNITAENGIHVVSFILNYDNEKLVLTNDLDEEDDNALLCVSKLPKDWENLSVVANDYSDENPEGTVVNPLNDGIIEVNVFTAKSVASAAIKEDGELEFEFTFKVVDDAEGDIGLVIPHATAEGAYNGKDGEIVYEATGSYAVIRAPVVEGPSEPDEPVVPGDASGMIIFAIIALVAIAGSAVVIKTRK